MVRFLSPTTSLPHFLSYLECLRPRYHPDDAQGHLKLLPASLIGIFELKSQDYMRMMKMARDESSSNIPYRKDCSDETALCHCATRNLKLKTLRNARA